MLWQKEGAFAPTAWLTAHSVGRCCFTAPQWTGLNMLQHYTTINIYCHRTNLNLLSFFCVVEEKRRSPVVGWRSSALSSPTVVFSSETLLRSIHSPCCCSQTVISLREVGHILPSWSLTANALVFVALKETDYQGDCSLHSCTDWALISLHYSIGQCVLVIHFLFGEELLLWLKAAIISIFIIMYNDEPTENYHLHVQLPSALWSFWWLSA